MARHATVDKYIAALAPPLDDVGRRARSVIEGELKDAHAAIKWAQPVWSIGKKPVCYVKGASKHVGSGSGTERRSTIRPVGSRHRAR